MVRGLWGRREVHPRTRHTGTVWRAQGSTKWAARALLAAFAVALALIVLLPPDGHQALGLAQTLARAAERLGFPYAPAFAVIEFGANIALFVPFGLLLPLALGSVRRTTLFAAVAAGAATSMCIELAQLAIPGRVSTPADVLANTIGTAIGVGMIHLATRRSPSGSRRTAAQQHADAAATLGRGETVAPIGSGDERGPHPDRV